MPLPKSSSLADVLAGSDPRLEQLAVEARRIMQLRDTLRRYLPPSLTAHLLGADMDGHILIMYMDSSASAATVRYRQRELLAATGLHCTELQVRVMPEPSPAPAAPRLPRQLPDAVRRVLESTADGIGEGPLARALRRLARGPAPRS
ncbi:MAG: hypothetical protein KGJ56_06245 [Gammaproteobacteria bacterium]|nr:hypothetical protein [Gammaproteobacteria bacterium]